MARKSNKKYLAKRNDYWRAQNKKLYVRMRELEARLNQYEQNVAGQFSVLTSHYEGIICYLIKKIGWDGVSENMVAEWAKDKEYALTAKQSDDGELIWTPVIKVIEDEIEK